MGNNSILHELARAKAAFQLRAIEAVICAPAHGSKHDQNMQETQMTAPDTDTLAGLREELRLIGCHQNGDARCTCAIGADALDAIDALRAQAAKDKARIERLEAALREISNCGQSVEPDNWRFRSMARGKARAALEDR